MQNKFHFSKENKDRMTIELQDTKLHKRNFNPRLELKNLRIKKNKNFSLVQYHILFHRSKNSLKSPPIIDPKIQTNQFNNNIYKNAFSISQREFEKNLKEERNKKNENLFMKSVNIDTIDSYNCEREKIEEKMKFGNWSITNFENLSGEREKVKSFKNLKNSKSVTFEEGFISKSTEGFCKNLIKIRKNFLDDLNILFKNPKKFKISNLLENERTLIYYILCRKMKKNIFLIIDFDKKINLEVFTDLIKEYINFRSSKRFEEIFKLIFKSFINHKKNLIFGKNIYKKKDEFSIYIHYFNKKSCELNIPIQHFMDPTKGKHKKKFKNFRKSYLKLILQSKSFKKDFVNFLTNDLQKVYFNKIGQKLEVMINKLFEIYEKKLNDEKKKNNFDNEMLFKKVTYQYFVKENQCKITWSTREIIDSICKLLRMISKIK